MSPAFCQLQKVGNEGGHDDDDDDGDDDDDDEDDDDDDDDDNDNDDGNVYDLQSILTAGCLPPSSESNTDASSWLLSSCFHDDHNHFEHHQHPPLEVVKDKNIMSLLLI